MATKGQKYNTWGRSQYTDEDIKRALDEGVEYKKVKNGTTSYSEGCRYIYCKKVSEILGCGRTYVKTLLRRPGMKAYRDKLIEQRKAEYIEKYGKTPAFKYRRPEAYARNLLVAGFKRDHNIVIKRSELPEDMVELKMRNIALFHERKKLFEKEKESQKGEVRECSKCKETKSRSDFKRDYERIDKRYKIWTYRMSRSFVCLDCQKKRRKIRQILNKQPYHKKSYHFTQQNINRKKDHYEGVNR